MKEDIGTDRYGRKMLLYYQGRSVYCDHVRYGKVERTNSICVDDSIIRMFSCQNISGAYIYDEIHRRYGCTL